MRDGAKLLQDSYHQLLRAVHVSRVSRIPTQLKNKYVGLAALIALTAGFGGLVIAGSSSDGTALGLQTNNQTDPLVVSNPAENSISASTNSNTSSNSSTSSTEVEVNGESIVVPQNGEFHKVISGDNGNTNIDISVQNNNSGGTNHSSSKIKINSKTKSSVTSSQNSSESGEGGSVH